MRNDGFEPLKVDQGPASPIADVTFSAVSDVGTSKERYRDSDFAPIDGYTQPDGDNTASPMREQQVPDLEQLAVHKQMDYLVRKMRGLGLFIILLIGIVGAGFFIFNDYVIDYQVIIGFIIAEIAVIAFFVFVIIMTKHIHNMEQ